MPARCALFHSAPAARASARPTVGLLTLCAGVLDAASSVMTTEACQKVMSIIGGSYQERWPHEVSRIILFSTVFTYTERITALTFLYGNLRDGDLVYAAVSAQLGVDPCDHDHARRFLADLASGKYNLKYFYFDVLAGDWLFLSGAVNLRHTPPSPLARALLAWKRECVRVRRTEGRCPSLAEQNAFGLGF